MKRILLLMMSILMSFQLFAQFEVQIGNGTTSTTHPLPGYYGWHRSAMLYKADEINVSGTISAIAYEIKTASTGTTAKMKIYLVETTNSTMPAVNAISWNDLKTGATLVYENNALAAAPTGWKTFTFDTPFTYSGTSNLMVLIEGEGCSTTGGCSVSCAYHTADNMHWYHRKDSSAPNDSVPPTNVTDDVSKRSNIKLTITPPEGFCYPPSNLAVSNLMSTSADFTWTTHTSGNYWEVQYKESSDTVWSAEQITYIGEYSLTNLDPETSYDFRVKSICASDISGWVTISFTTNCAEITTLPWTDSFDTYGTGTTVFPPCWTRNTTYADRPYVNGTNYSAPGSLYFYAGSGTYNIAATPMFDASIPINTLRASFMYRTTNANDTLFIGVMTDPNDASTFEQVAFLKNSSTATWYPKEVFFTNYTGQGKYIAFMVRYHTGVVYGYIDDLSIDLIPSCPKPSNITVVSAETDQLEIGWQENGTATSWTFEYKKVGDLIWNEETVTTNPHTLYNLETATFYTIRVKSDCSSEESDYSEEVTVMTSCGQIATLPWSDSFDLYGTGSGTFPTCWTKISSNTNPYISSTYKNSIPGSMYMYTASGAYNYAVTPEFASSVAINSLTAYMMLYKTSSAYSIDVGVISDLQDLTTFDSITTLSPTATSTWQQFSVDFASYTGTGKYIAFRVKGVGAANGMYMDDVWIGLTPSCNTPTGLASVSADLTENSITLDWDGADDANVLSWNVFYKPVDATDWQTVVANSHPFVLTGLQPNLVYNIMISANCLTGEPTPTTSPINIGMPCVSINTFPWSEGFEDAWYVAYGLNTGTHPWCWTNINGGTQSGGVWRKTTSSSYVHTGNGALQMYSGSTTAGLQGDWFITPVLSLTGNEQFSFWAKGYSTYTDILSVKIFDASLGAVSTESDTTNFVDLMPNTVIPATEWTLYELSLNQYVGDYQIAFVRNTTGGYYLNIDDVLVEPVGDCARPTNVAVTAVTPYSAEIDFLPANAISFAWYLYYKPQTSTDWDSVYINTYPYSLEGLIPSTTYEFYLRTECGADLSDPTVIVTFTTECLPIDNFPWTESFEDLTAASTLPPCWTATRFGTYTNTQITDYNSYNRNARTGTAAAFFRWSCDDHFFTPGFQLQAGIAYEFSFWYVTDGLSGWQTLEVGTYSAQAASALVQTIAAAPTLSNTTYQEFSVYFTPTTDGVYYFGVYCQANGTPFYLTLDDFSFDHAPDCLPVSQLQVSNIAGSSAYLTWTPVGTPDYFAIEIEDLSTQAIVNETTTEYFFVLTGLSEQTEYSVSVSPMCGGVEGAGDTIQFITTCLDGGDVIVGTPDATTSTNGAYFPTQTFYDFSLTEQIFDAAELSDLGDSIFGLAFQYFYATSVTRNVEVYLGHTDKTTFTGTSDYVPASSLTMVYNGSVTWTNTNSDYWVEINFTTPFAYDSDSNLVIVVRDMTDDYEISAAKFRTHSTSGTKAIYFYQDGSSISLASPSAMYSGAVSTRNNIKFVGDCNPVTCAKPNIILTDLDVTSATVTIVPGLYETSWQGEYKVATDTQWTSLGSITYNEYILDNLTSNTTYQFRLRSECGTEYSSWRVISFTTLCGDIEQLPFAENFDSYPAASGSIPTCWYSLSTQGSIYPYIVTTTPQSSPNCAYFYSTGTNHSTLILPPLSENLDITTLQLKFWARTATLGHQLEVGVMTDPTDILTFTQVGIAAPTMTGTYQDFEVNFNTYTGTGKYIAIRSNGISTVYMDDVVLDEMPDCARPTNITFTDILQTEATVSWLPTPTAMSYEVVYGLPGIDPDTVTPLQVADTFVTITGLSANTVYHVYVRSFCSNGNNSEWTNMSFFRTACGVISTLPWSDSFDSYGTGTTVFPVCWTRTTTQANRPYIHASTYYSAPGALYFYAPSGTYNIAATPEIDASIPINTLQVEFMYRSSYTTDTIFVGVMTDPTNASTFEQVDFIKNDFTSTWYEKEVSFSNYTGNGHYIAFMARYGGTSAAYGYIDDVVINTISGCPKPTQLQLTSVGATELGVGWTENGTATSWIVSYKKVTDTVWEEDNAATNPYTITNLDPQTDYMIRVQADCGTETSAYSLIMNASTACLPLNTLPWTEGFEDLTAATTLPPCWAATSFGTHTNTQISDYSSYNRQARTGTGAAYFRYGANNHFFTPGFDLQAGVTYEFSFWYVTDGMSGWQTLEAGVYSSQMATSFIQAVATQTAPQNTTYQEMVGAFTPATSGTYYFGVYCQANTSPWYLTMDDFSVDLGPSCPKPLGLYSTNVTSTSLDLGWIESGTATAWEVEYGAEGFTQGSGTIVQAATNPVTISGLTESTCYDFYVRAVCAAGETSEWSVKQTLCTSQIPANVPFVIDFETPSGFVFANNSSGNNWHIGSAADVNNTTGGSNGLYISNDNGVTNAYSNTSAVVWAYRDIYFTPSTDDYTLTFDWKCQGESSYDFFNVYIGSPLVPVASTTSTIAVPAGVTTLGTNINLQNTWQVKTYTLPAADYSGQTMRLYFCWRNDASTANQPPAAIDNIGVTSTGISSCLPPTNLAISNITSDGATANWGGTANSWVFEYKTTAATTWTTQAVTTATYTMTGLQPSTTYETRVKAICDAGEVSDYSSVVSFTTSATPCVTPTNLQVTNITDQSALATWTAGGTETSWQVDYKLASATNWTTGTATTNSFAMTGLQSNSNYEVRVKAICTAGESAFTEPVPFTTAGTTTYTITATAGPHGTITPSGDVTVNEGGSQTFTFTPEAGYRIDVVLVDGAPQVPVPESYTFENIQANHTIHVDFAEGIAENELSQYVTLYPNPTQSLIDLKLDRDYLGTTECRIYDMYGKLMRIMPIEEEITTIDVSDFATGVYFVRLTTEQGQVSKRFVKK